MQANIGTMSSYKAYADDADATAWIAASGISDTTGIHSFFKGLKDNQLWDAMRNSGNGAAWLLFGGSEATTKLNIFDPVDADASHRLVYVSAPTFTSSGADPNGSTNYADTHVRTDANGFDNFHMAAYSMENAVNSGVGNMDISYFNIAGTIGSFLAIGHADIGDWRSNVGGLAYQHFYHPTNLGMMIVSVESGTSSSHYRNGVYYGGATGTTGITGNSGTYKLFHEPTFTDDPSPRKLSFASIGGPLTKVQAESLHSLVKILLQTRGIAVL